jgi:hypothetical protein
MICTELRRREVQFHELFATGDPGTSFTGWWDMAIERFMQRRYFPPIPGNKQFSQTESRKMNLEAQVVFK